MDTFDKRAPGDGVLLDEIAEISLAVEPMPLSCDEAERCRSLCNVVFLGRCLDREDREWVEALVFRLRALALAKSN